MNSYRWICPACKSPNILVMDENKEGHTTLGCKACGEPGILEKGVLTMSPGYPPISVSLAPVYASTCTVYDITRPSRVIGGDY